MSEPELVDDAPFIEITGIHRISRSPMAEGPGGSDLEVALDAFLCSIAQARLALTDGSAESVSEGIDELDDSASLVMSLMKELICVPTEREVSPDRRPR